MLIRLLRWDEEASIDIRLGFSSPKVDPTIQLASRTFLDKASCVGVGRVDVGQFVAGCVDFEHDRRIPRTDQRPSL